MNTRFVCLRCIGDPYLRRELREARKTTECMSCATERSAIPLPLLAKRVDRTILDNWVVDESEEGPDYAALLETEAKLQKDVAEAIQDFLSKTDGFRAEKDGELNIWRDACFEEAPLDRDLYRQRWAAFRTSIREEGRFYNKRAENILDDIFKDVLDARTWKGEPAVVEMKPAETLAPLIRGRVAKSEKELIAILSDLAAQLGPPPADLATAGRMNAAGVSVFYCAFDQDICCKECRPPVGSHVIYGYFDLLRPIRILNLSRLAWMSVPETSIFAPDFSHKAERAGFLRQLDWEISQPVMPGDEAFGYLHTQAVADYLAHRLGLDGVLYRSTQSGVARNVQDPPQNLVLFHHASRIEPLDLANWDIQIDLGWWDEDEQDGDDGISIAATEKVAVTARTPQPDPANGWFGIAKDPGAGDEREPTFRILRDRIEVERIQAALYERDKRYVTHTSTTLAEQAEQAKKGPSF